MMRRVVMQYQQASILLTLIAVCNAMPAQLLCPFIDRDSAAANRQERVSECDYDYKEDADVENVAETSQALDISRRQSYSESSPAHYILSMATGQFVAITKSGRVNANTQIGMYSVSLEPVTN